MMMKKLWLFGLCGLLLFILSACEEGKKAESSLSGTNISGTVVSWTVSHSTSGAQDISRSEIFSWSFQTWSQASWGFAVPIKSLFPVELCNKIIAFNQCIIAKAPVENQPVMKQQLVKVIQPWRLLVETQLREVCQQIAAQENFLEVVKHYQEQGCKF